MPCPSRRSLRSDEAFDRLIDVIFPDRTVLQKHNEDVMAKLRQTTNMGAVAESVLSGMKVRAVARSRRPPFGRVLRVGNSCCAAAPLRRSMKPCGCLSPSPRFLSAFCAYSLRACLLPRLNTRHPLSTRRRQDQAANRAKRAKVFVSDEIQVRRRPRPTSASAALLVAKPPTFLAFPAFPPAAPQLSVNSSTRPARASRSGLPATESVAYPAAAATAASAAVVNHDVSSGPATEFTLLPSPLPEHYAVRGRPALFFLVMLYLQIRVHSADIILFLPSNPGPASHAGNAPSFRFP